MLVGFRFTSMLEGLKAVVEVKSEKAIDDVSNRPFVMVGIPAFNEEKSIARVVLSAQDHADSVVVCDDGSNDFTAVIAERLGAEIVRHDRNLGYGAAIQSLFGKAKKIGADVLVTLDGDGQHDPSQIPRVVKPIEDGSADFVVGSRFLSETSAAAIPWHRRAGIRVITRATNGHSNESLKDAQSGFRAYSRKCIENLKMSENGMGVSSEILINARKQNLKIQEVPIHCEYRNGLKTSRHNPVKHGFGVLGSIVKLVVEDKPFLTLGLPGIISLGTGLFFGLWMLQIYATSEPQHIETNVALASMAFIIIGLFFVFTAITLYSISRAVQKVSAK